MAGISVQFSRISFQLSLNIKSIIFSRDFAIPTKPQSWDGSPPRCRNRRRGQTPRRRPRSKRFYLHCLLHFHRFCKLYHGAKPCCQSSAPYVQIKAAGARYGKAVHFADIVHFSVNCHVGAVGPEAHTPARGIRVQI